jgi:cysteine desulfurase
VVRVTGNFTSESPLHPAAREALLAAFDQGWADPKKISQSSARAAILKNQSLENIGNRLGVRPDAIEIIGEPALGHFLAIAGLLSPTQNFAYASIDKGKIRAIAHAHSGPVQEMEVDSKGQISGATNLPDDTVISLQLANGETGIIQKFLPTHRVKIAVDATASGPRLPLPENWSTALFDAQSWAGPSGVGILAVNDFGYSYPLPRIAPIKSPGTYSLPLLIAASIALENFAPEDAEMRRYLIESFTGMAGISVVAADTQALPHKISLSIPGIVGEQVVRTLAEGGIDIDSGSACSAADLQPSHVLAAMGYPTTGHVRITLHSGTTHGEIDALKKAISQAIS